MLAQVRAYVVQLLHFMVTLQAQTSAYAFVSRRNLQNPVFFRSCIALSIDPLAPFLLPTDTAAAHECAQETSQ